MGKADPSTIPADTAQLVTLTVPGGSDWMIYANGGGLMNDMDLAGRRGERAVKIVIDKDGNPSSTSR